MDKYILWVRRVLPTPLSIALLLTLFSFLGVFLYQISSRESVDTAQSLQWWSDGLWQPNMLAFAMQMMLMLVLGHALALSPAVEKLILGITKRCRNSAQAAWLVCTSALVVGLFNWSLGLIFGAVLARKVADQFAKTAKPLNYPLIGAAGYAALMIWHGGLSGSALIKAAEPNSIRRMLNGVVSENTLQMMPTEISMANTAFSQGNILVSIALIVALPAILYFIGTRITGEVLEMEKSKTEQTAAAKPIGAECIDQSRWIGLSIGGGILCYVVFLLSKNAAGFFTPDHINLTLFGLSLLLHQRISKFITATNSAISGASGILIQFPIYFGIMGLIHNSGLVNEISDFFISISNRAIYPLLTFASAGLVNIFIPSGGGQWVIQGPIVIKSAVELGVPIEKSLLALAYGDQITNMLQPFWALPLLGITRLSARDILPYTLVMFCVGSLVFIAGLILM